MTRWNVSVREARMCVERILLTCNLPEGMVHGIREAVLTSQSLGLGGFAHLLEHARSLDASKYERAKLHEHADGSLEVDGAGLHAWLLVPLAADLVVDAARRRGRGELVVTNVIAAAELGVVSGLAPRYGAQASDSGGRIVATSRARPRTSADWDPLLDRAVHEGYPVDAALWHAVYARSGEALAPDSVVSRRHAGPVILADDGRILGRIPEDDDFDMNMLKKV